MSRNDQPRAAEEAGLGLTKVERDPLHERVYQEVRKAIMSGAIKPGAAITIRALAAALGTSPMPVREALRRLIAERALESLPNRSVVLPRLTPERFAEIRRIRIALEGIASEAAAGRISAADLARLAAIHGEMLAIGDETDPAFLALNREFHFTIYQAAEMPVLFGIIESLWLQIGPLLNHSITRYGRQTAFDHHGAVLAALEARDGAAARDAIAADLMDAGDVVLEAIRQEIAAD